MTIETANPPKSITTSKIDNDNIENVSTHSISSSGSNSSTSPVPTSPRAPLNKSKSLKGKEKQGLMTSIRRSSSVKKLTGKLNSFRSKPMSKGNIEKLKRKVRKNKKSEDKPESATSESLPQSVKTIDVGSPTQPSSANNEEESTKFDEETCFNVEFDLPAGMEGPDETVAAAGFTTKENTTTIVLLLLDGRRFELLQLEMNPETAIIQDILDQIPVEATDKALRGQTYVGVCERNGVSLDKKKFIKDYFPSDFSMYYIAMAIPQIMTREEVVKFSKPIFSDTSISTMFKGSKQEGISTVKPVPKTEDSTVPAPKSEKNTITAPKSEEAASSVPRTEETVTVLPKTEETITTVPNTEETAADDVPTTKENVGTTPKIKETTEDVPQAAMRGKKQDSFSKVKDKLFGKKTDEKKKRKEGT